MTRGQAEILLERFLESVEAVKIELEKPNVMKTKAQTEHFHLKEEILLSMQGRQRNEEA